jgi:hypothetical protein
LDHFSTVCIQWFYILVGNHHGFPLAVINHQPTDIGPLGQAKFCELYGYGALLPWSDSTMCRCGCDRCDRNWPFSGSHLVSRLNTLILRCVSGINLINRTLLVIIGVKYGKDIPFTKSGFMFGEHWQ